MDACELDLALGTHHDRKYDKIATGRYRLIVTETAWLLWKCRNERVIGQKEIQPSQLRSRWVAEMNNRIELEYTRILKSKRIDKTNDIKSFKEMWVTNRAIVELEKG